MSIRDDFRTKEEIFKSDYITLGERSMFDSMDDLLTQMIEYAKIKEEPIKSRFEILDL